MLTNFGDTGWGAVGLSLTGEFPNHRLQKSFYILKVFFLLVKYYSPATNVCIIRVARDQHKLAWGALTLLTSIEGLRYIPNVVHVSGKYPLYHCALGCPDRVCEGTIKHAQLAAIAHNREVVARYMALAKTSGMNHSL